MRPQATWTMKMLHRVREKLSAGRTPLAVRQALAAELGVSFYALEHKAKDLKLGKKNIYTPEDAAYVLANYRKLKTVMIARWIGKSPVSVRRWVHRLRKKQRLQIM